MNIKTIIHSIFAFIKKHYKKAVCGFGFVLFLGAVLAVIVGGNFIYYKIFPTGTSGDVTEDEPECSVVGINLHGTLVTYLPANYFDDPAANKDVVASEEITHYIEKAGKDDAIKAILLEIDSNGGMSVAGEEIANALKRANKPSVAVIRQSGLSAAYWATTGANYIFASKNSDVGSIGVTASYLENVGKNQKDGYRFVQLSAGKYKDSGDPDKILSEEEKALIMRDVKIIHENFINAVAENRNISVDDVRKVGDGSSVLGGKAKELKLIDEIGDLNGAKDYIKNIIGEEPEVCW